MNRSTVRLVSALVTATVCGSVGATASARIAAPPTPVPAPAAGAVLAEGDVSGCAVVTAGVVPLRR